MKVTLKAIFYAQIGAAIFSLIVSVVQTAQILKKIEDIKKNPTQ